MSNTSEIWVQIKDLASKENLVSSDELAKLDESVEAGGITPEDWRLAVENTHLVDGHDDQS